jgi:tagatose 1,6-diphosphate aldolase
MRRLADEAGRWKMIAIDQRGPMMGPIARARGLEQAPYEDMAAVKATITQQLAPLASAVLHDPNFGYPRSTGVMSPRTGLMLALEHHITQESAEGRRSECIPDWSVAQIRGIGADAVKLLAWYRPDASVAVREHQQAWVHRIGQECKKHDIVLLLELLVYPLAGDAPGQLEANRTQLVLDSMRDFASPDYCVDIYKMEPPAMLRGVPDPSGPRAAEVQRAYDELARLITRPWVLLSAATGPEDFERSLTYAYRAGASGYLCGRAIWQQAFERFPDFNAMQQELAGPAVRYVHRINALTDRMAVPWTQYPGWNGGVTMSIDGPHFAAAYAAS